MSASVLYMSMSLDGFIAGPNVSLDNGIGDGGLRLHEWIFADVRAGNFDTSQLNGANRIVHDEMMATGAVVAGRGTFEPAGGWNGDHHDGVPIYIVSRHPKPETMAHWPRVHYVSELSAAVRAAKAAAGERNVLVHGSGIARMAIPDGLLDELEIHLVPVLLGEGTKLFEHLGLPQRELERVRVLAGDDGMVHLRYRIRR